MLNETSTTASFAPDTITNSIGEFLYNTKGVRFPSYYWRYKITFRNDCHDWTDWGWGRRLLLRKLCPKNTKNIVITFYLKRNITFLIKLLILSKLFSESSVSYKIQNITKKDSGDFVSYACIQNGECVKSKPNELSSDMF